MKLLTFKNNNQLYAIDIANIIEINQYDESKINAIPDTLDCVIGCTKIRDFYVNIVDFGKALGYNCTRESFIVVESNSLKFGILVEHVLDVLNIDTTKPFPTPISDYYVEIGGELCTLLNLEKFLKLIQEK